MDITIAEITRWASSTELDDLFAQRQAEDPEGFFRMVIDACDDATLLEFIKNRNSTKRQFFAWALVQILVHGIYSPHGLPFPFSRFQGMIPLEQYQASELARIENVYQKCCVVEELRNSGQEEIKNLGDMILDFRHDRLFPNADIPKLLQLLDYQIELSLRPEVQFCRMRICKTCGDGFKFWTDAVEQIHQENCPFCILGIAYPQKGGKNKSQA